jgi:hypothetical protein
VPPAPVITLYRRPGCSLCDAAERELVALAAELGFTVAALDITGVAALERAYRWAIPVVALGDRELARAPIRGPRLREALIEALAPGG